MEHPGRRLGALQAGGPLREGSLYIQRRADADLDEALARGGLSAVIAPWQMGKSSLRRRARRRLEARGVRAIDVDLGIIGSANVSEDRWVNALVASIAARLGETRAPIAVPSLDETRAPIAASLADRDLVPAQRLARFLREDLPANAAVFLDEIDAALALPFPLDDMLEALATSASPRLAICLIGVTEPDRWTRGPARSLASLQVIRPGPFTREEAAAFLPALATVDSDAEALLAAVLARTGGHPYLTQRIVEILVQDGAVNGVSPADRVDHAVNDGLGEDPAARAIRR